LYSSLRSESKNLKKNVLGDGDSSVTKRLNEILPYGPSLRVEKIECRNHMLRNYSQKMSALTKRTEFPNAIRKKIADNLVRLRTDVTKAIKYRKSEEKPLQQKILSKYLIQWRFVGFIEGGAQIFFFHHDFFFFPLNFLGGARARVPYSTSRHGVTNLIYVIVYYILFIYLGLFRS